MSIDIVPSENSLTNGRPNVFTDIVEKLWPGAKVALVYPHRLTERVPRAPRGWLEEFVASPLFGGGKKFTKTIHWMGLKVKSNDDMGWYGEYRVDPENERYSWLKFAAWDFEQAVYAYNKENGLDRKAIKDLKFEYIINKPRSCGWTELAMRFIPKIKLDGVELTDSEYEIAHRVIDAERIWS